MQKKDPLSETQKAYMAGFFDGEGCVRIHKVLKNKNFNYDYSPRLSITSQAKEPLLLFQKTFGGSLTQDKVIYSELSNKKCWHWYISYKKAMVVCKSLLPYLHIKKQQVEALLEIETWKRKKGRGHRYTQKDLEPREELFLRLKSLKRKDYHEAA